MHNNVNRAVHCRWPLCVLVDEKSILPEINIINIDEGKVIQSLKILEKVLPSYLCWHEELLVLVVGFEHYFEVWTLDHDLRYIELLDEGIIAPRFDIKYDDYYNSVNEICKYNQKETQGFGVTDILGVNHRKRLNIFWSQRYRNIKLRLFKRVDLSEVNKNDATLKSMHWLDHNKLVLKHSSSSCGTFLTVWKFQFEIFNIDIYKEIISRRLEKKSNAFLNDLENLYIEILTGVDSRPLLRQELSFSGPRIDLKVAFDNSERFILVYQHLDNELFIWRYEYSDRNDQIDKNTRNTRISGILPNQFQFQKISLKQGEKILSASWKPCSSNIPYKLKKLGGISELSSFSMISRNSEEIIVRIWRESSLNKPCQFIQALYLRFNDRPLVRNEDINLIWESFRDNVIHHFNSVETLDKSIKDFNTELEDPSYYYSTSRFPLIEDDSDEYFYYINSDYDEEFSRSSIPLNSCIHNRDIFTMNEKQNKVVKLIISIGKETFCFNVFQLGIWNDEINSSIKKWEICKFNNIENNNLLNNLEILNNNSNFLPDDMSNIIIFWKNNKLSNRSNGNIYNFIFKLKDSNIVEYILNEKTGTWNLLKLTRIIPEIQSNLENNLNIHGKLAVELTNTNEILILLNNGHILLLDNLNPKKLFTFIHANKFACIQPHINTLNINVDTGIEINNNIYDLCDFGIESIINISEGIVSSYYQILLVKLNKGTQLKVFGLTSICENGSSTLELLEVEINSRERIFGGEFEDLSVDDADLSKNHEKILEKLFSYNLMDNIYEIVFLDKHSSVIGGYCICVCLVKDLVLEVNHIIMFEIRMENQDSLLFNQVERTYDKTKIRLELRIVSPPMYQNLSNLNFNNSFLLIKQPSTENSLIFVTNEVFVSGSDYYQKINSNTKELGQIYIYICSISDSQDNKMDIIAKIKLNRSFFDFSKDLLLMDTFDYNLLIYNITNGELLCYSLLSLNMLNIEEDSIKETISLNPFQLISMTKDHGCPQLKSSNLSKENLKQDSENYDNQALYNKARNSQLVILQDFEMTYFCFFINYGKIVGSIYWNKNVCRWETNKEIDLYNHFKMNNSGELIKIQRLEVFDGIYLFFNTNDKIVPRIYKRPENDVFEKNNNFSLKHIQVLEDFVFSLNDRKQSFSVQIFEKIRENLQESPNLNIIPYSIDNSFFEYDNDHGKSLDDLGEYQRLYNSLFELRINNKKGHIMSIMEFEECQIKRFFIRKNYFDMERKGGLVLKSEDICWISLCEKDQIVDKILSNGDSNIVDWKDLKRFGLIYILTESNQFQEFVERWIQKLYQKLVKVIAEKRKELSFEFTDNKTKKTSDISQDEMLNIVIIIYTCLNKLNIVSAIFKILDQKNVFDFLLNYNVNNEELRKQAIKNGYYLIKQRNYYWSLCFFLLSRSYDEITNVCIKYLNDPQLLLLLLKLLINLNGINDNEKNNLVNLYNKHLNDLWLLSLMNKDPWLSIISILNYSSINHFKFNNINRMDILNIILKLSSPTIFFKVCELMNGIEYYFKMNINQEETIQNNQVENFIINHHNSYDLSYSFIHPEHLFLFNNYIKFKISLSSQSKAYESNENSKYPSFENIIEIISYYIKKCMNPYHYISWLSYIEENNTLFKTENLHYHNYYNLIIKPNIINRIKNYVRYLHNNYFFFLNNNNLLNWINKFSKIPEFISIFNFNFNQAKSNITINPINIFNYLLLINVDKYYEKNHHINTGIHTENDVINDDICRIHVACKKRLSNDFSEFRGQYLNLIFEIFSNKQNSWELNNLGFGHLWEVLFEFFSRINNEIILTFQTKKVDLINIDYNRYIRNKCELFILILQNKINQTVIELLFQTGNEANTELEPEIGFSSVLNQDSKIMIKLLKIYMVMVLTQELIVKMESLQNINDVFYSNKLLKYKNFVKILKFVIILKSYHKLDLHLKRTLTKRLGVKLLKFLRLLLKFSKEYGYINEIQSNTHNIIQEEINNNTFQFQKSDKLIYFNTILIVLSTSILKIHQDLIDENINNENDINSSIQEESFKYQVTNQLSLALRECYYNRVFKEWKEIIVSLLPLILTYYYDSIDEKMSVLFIRVATNLNNQQVNSNNSTIQVIVTKIILVLEQIWIGMGIRDLLLLNVLRNRELIMSYDVGSINNLYYYLLKKVWNFEENTSKDASNASTTIELESSEQFSVSLLTCKSSKSSSLSSSSSNDINNHSNNNNNNNTKGDNSDLGFKLEKLKLDFSNEYFKLSDETFKYNKKEESIKMNNPSLFMINMSIYNHRIVPTPKLNLAPNLSINSNQIKEMVLLDQKTESINEIIDNGITKYEDDDFYYYNCAFNQDIMNKEHELFESENEDEIKDGDGDGDEEFEEDYYYKWYKNRIQKEGELEGTGKLPNTLLGHLLYQESPIIMDCKMDPNNSPFLLLGEKTHLILNSKLYFIHPISFIRKNHLNSYYYEEIIFQRRKFGPSEEFYSIFKSGNIIKLEVLFNSYLLKRLLIFKKLHENQDNYGLISYRKLQKSRSKKSISPSISSPSIMPIYDIDFCVNIKKGIKSIYLDLYSSKENENNLFSELNRGVLESSINYNNQEIRFLQIFMDIPLSFSKIKNQFNNVKAIICGEAIQLRNPKVTHIVYPYWSHSLAFSNYHKVNHPNYFIGDNNNNNNITGNTSDNGNNNNNNNNNNNSNNNSNNNTYSKSSPKPVMISNNLSKSYYNSTKRNVNNGIYGNHNFSNNSLSSAFALNKNLDPGKKSFKSNDSSFSNNKLMVNNHHLGNITHVSWSPSKIHIILSTSNGFIMVYKLNSNNNYLIDQEDEIFLPSSALSSSSNIGKINSKINPNNINLNSDSTKNIFLTPLSGNYSSNNYTSSNTNSASNPFIPIYIFQVHKSNCYWSCIIDHSCRYFLTSGNGINFVYSSNNHLNDQGEEFGMSLNFGKYTKYNSRGERVPVVGSNIVTTTTTNTNTNTNTNTTTNIQSLSTSAFPHTNSININNYNYSNSGIISESIEGLGGSLINSGTLNLAEFMGDNTLNLSSKIEISSVLSDENCLCIWDIWTNLSYNLSLISRPDLLIALESSPISVSHNWKQANTLLIITNTGNLWFISYLFGRQFLNPSLFKLKQKNILTSNLSNMSMNNNTISRNPNYISSKLTVFSSDGTCIIYNIFLLLKSSFKRCFNNNQITIVPIIKFNINHSVSINPLNIINNSLSSNQYNKIISNAIFISKNTLLIIDSQQNCKIVQLLPFFS
ncbi:uncharacterized protein cubi_00318 [Cryptosporidium ubiquitum]|uniref:RAVE complex protein Rav1 C-terminal domain-containing protein n=1 Tax=Cryptosporidium ubiquitum TaxID=857276 RepID=A0A1J4MPG2_9CRYT|nr:uncharacterized protein cubi_00318 [Cryptosporidium ubiquitum]OII74765.1 hypothetical protein cubi_00318 [Cryptosporidium ubiquitum]